MQIGAAIARRKLATLWGVTSVCILLFSIIQHLLGKFEDQAYAIWLWISPNVFPTLGLIIGGLIVSKNGRVASKAPLINYQMCFYGSVFYLVVLIFILLGHPFSNKPMVDYYRGTSIFLTPMQSLLSGLIGFFFVSNGEKSA